MATSNDARFPTEGVAARQGSDDTPGGASLDCNEERLMRGGVSSKVSLWRQKVDAHREKQLINPFSEWEGASHRQRMSKDDKDYGIPKGQTAWRGQQAGVRISNEIKDLVTYVRELGEKQEDGSVCLTFGLLFNMYVKISNKLVGILMRARKQNLVAFEGEMLWQGRDDDVIITLLPGASEAISQSQ